MIGAMGQGVSGWTCARRVVLAGAVVVSAVSAAPLMQPEPVRQGPRLSVSTTPTDFGRVREDEVLKGAMTFRNLGDADLHVVVLRSCSVRSDIRILDGQNEGQGTFVNQFVVASGGVVNAEYQLQVFGRAGQSSWPIAFRSNDAAQEITTVEIQADVAVCVETTPQRLVLGEVYPGATIKSRVRVIGDGADFKVTRATLSNFEGTVVIHPGEQFVEHGVVRHWHDLEIDIKAGMKLGRVGGAALIRTNHPLRRFAGLEIAGEVVSDVRVEPVVRERSMVDPGARGEHVYRVSSRSGKPFEILSVDSTGGKLAVEGFTTTPVDGAGNTVHDLRVAWVAPKEAGWTTQWLDIQTSLPEFASARHIVGVHVRKNVAAETTDDSR